MSVDILFIFQGQVMLCLNLSGITCRSLPVGVHATRLVFPFFVKTLDLVADDVKSSLSSQEQIGNYFPSGSEIKVCPRYIVESHKLILIVGRVTIALRNAGIGIS